MQWCGWIIAFVVGGLAYGYHLSTQQQLAARETQMRQRFAQQHAELFAAIENSGNTEWLQSELELRKAELAALIQHEKEMRANIPADDPRIEEYRLLLAAYAQIRRQDESVRQEQKQNSTP